MTSKRILIADDHEIIRKGLRTILSCREEWEVVGEVANGRDAVKRAEELRPDVVVMDISMPQLNGLEAVRQIAKVSPDTRVLVLTMHESEDLIRETLHAGARGYVLKSDTSARLVPAVEALLRDEPFLTPKAGEVVLRGFLGRGEAAAPAATDLTAREREIVQLVAEGKTSKEIAAILNISVKTAETHRTNVMKKLDLHSVSEIVLYAVRNHIIEA